MLNLTDIASLEKARKQREAARRMQESQRGESVMWRRPEAEWLPDYQRPGGHALEAPMFSPDDLIGSGISKPIMAGAKALAASAPAAALMGMAKSAGKSSLADVVRESGIGTAKPRAKGPVSELIPRGTKNLLEAGMEPDMARSILTQTVRNPDNPKELIKPSHFLRSDVNQAAELRQRYRNEPPTTPGAGASEDAWADWASGYGVNNFRLTKPVPLGFRDERAGRDAMIPGGLEGTFTIPDLFWMKSNNFDPNILPTDMRRDLMKKFMRTYQPDPNAAPDQVKLFNSLNFGMLSPAQALTSNEFAAMRSRVRNMDELKELAARTGEPNLRENLIREQGVQGAAKGGMGITGTADPANQAVLAKMLLEKPEMFQPYANESYRDVTNRLITQIPGMSQKTIGLSLPFANLYKGNTAAFDLHMIRNMAGDLIDHPEVGADFLADASKVLGKDHTKESLVKQLAYEAETPGVKQTSFAKIRPLVETTEAKVYRSKPSNELSEFAQGIPSLAPEKLYSEPMMAEKPGRYYSALTEILDKNRGANPDLPLLPEQWMKWDGYRGRIEPHEFAHPDYNKLPKQSFNEMQAALDEHKRVGYMSTPQLGVPPAMKESDWRKMYYGFVDPRLLGGMAAGGAAAGLGGHEYFADSINEMERKRLEDEARRRALMEAQ